MATRATKKNSAAGIPEGNLIPFKTASDVTISYRTTKSKIDAATLRSGMQPTPIWADQVTEFWTTDQSYYSSPRYLKLRFAFKRKNIHPGANFFNRDEPVWFSIWCSNGQSGFRWPKSHEHIPADVNGATLQTHWRQVTGHWDSEVWWYPQPATYDPVAFGLFLAIVRDGQVYYTRFLPPDQLVHHLPNVYVSWAPLELHNQHLWHGPYGTKGK